MAIMILRIFHIQIDIVKIFRSNFLSNISISRHFLEIELSDWSDIAYLDGMRSISATFVLTTYQSIPPKKLLDGLGQIMPKASSLPGYSHRSRHHSLVIVWA